MERGRVAVTQPVFEEMWHDWISSAEMYCLNRVSSQAYFDLESGPVAMLLTAISRRLNASLGSRMRDMRLQLVILAGWCCLMCDHVADVGGVRRSYSRELRGTFAMMLTVR